jgi:hypothetical protein
VQESNFRFEGHVQKIAVKLTLVTGQGKWLSNMRRFIKRGKEGKTTF